MIKIKTICNKTNAIIVALFMSLVSNATVPTRPPYEYQACSPNKAYCANVTVNNGVDVFKIDKNNKKYNIYHIDMDWRQQVFLSNSGVFFVTIGTTLITSNALKQPVIKIFKNGIFLKSMSASDIMGNTNEMNITTSGELHWGEPRGFNNSESCFLFDLDDGRTVFVPLDAPKSDSHGFE